MIPIDRIDVLNTRERNHTVFEEIVRNIRTVGLKKPITVTPRPGEDGERYLLVCGEGRLNAFRVAGETSIPALVVAVSDEDAFIMSLAENIARRPSRPLEMLTSINRLREKGYTAAEIASKTGLSVSYVSGILTLLQQNEERLLVAVEKGRIPLNTALTIASIGDDDTAMQVAMQEAYETGKLRGKKLAEARRIVSLRQSLGRSARRRVGGRKDNEVSSAQLVQTYQREVERQRIMVKKAELTQQRLLFVASALRRFLADENFVNLLRAEGLDTLPQYLAERVWPEGRA